MTKQYVPWTPDQSFLLPPSPREWLPEDHLVYFILDVVGGLSLGAIEAAIDEKDPRGNRPPRFPHRHTCRGMELHYRRWPVGMANTLLAKENP